MTNSESAETFFEDWDSGKEEFIIFSSGSTGKPKPILLKRKWMIWSAKKTAEVINPKESDSMLCCLPVNRVGGLMTLVRSKVWKIPVQIFEPSANPLLNPKIDSNIISLTPYQVSHILKSEESIQKLLSFREVLIGGSSLSSSLENSIKNFNKSVHFRQTYGMSETYSHIAIRNLNYPEYSNYFQVFPEIQIMVDEESRALIKAPFAEELIKTNDLIELVSEKQFKFIGRADFIINSAGVKIDAVYLENLISEQTGIEDGFLISSVEDEELGEKLVLVHEKQIKFTRDDLQFLQNHSPYYIPKLIIEIDSIPLNEGNKPDRLGLKNRIRRK